MQHEQSLAGGGGDNGRGWYVTINSRTDDIEPPIDIFYRTAGNLCIASPDLSL